MRPEPGWENRSWNGAAGLRQDRGRARRRLRIYSLIGVIFLYAIIQVGLSTEVSRRSNRVDHLRTEIDRAVTDLAVEQTRLESQRVFGQLLAMAEQGGFEPIGPHRTLAATTPPAATVGWVEQLTEDLHRGSRLLLPDALAQDIRAEGRGRGERP